VIPIAAPRVGKLLRLLRRQLPLDDLAVADRQIEYAKRHGLVGDEDEPKLARELARRRFGRALRRLDDEHPIPPEPFVYRNEANSRIAPELSKKRRGPEGLPVGISPPASRPALPRVTTDSG
jgi:hypothetical protein